MDKIKYIVAAILLAGCIHILVKSFIMSKAIQELKYDQATLNDAKYGLFNVDQWKTQLHTILFNEIANFQLEGENKEMLKVQLEKLLEALMDEVQKNFLSQSDGIWDKIKGALVGVVIDFNKLKDKIPEYADDILAELEKEENMEAIKNALSGKLDDWLEKAETGSDLKIQYAVLAKYECSSVKACSDQLQAQINEVQKSLWVYTVIGILFAIILWVVVLAGDAQPLDNYILALSCLILLIGGLMLPMLDIQAGIEKIRFYLMGQEISFDHQVLFFQSKSIVDVVKTLFQSLTFNGILVGILILLFSIVFPLAKMIASIHFINTHGQVRSRLMRFLVFDSGKWSMADVFVVALIMTYLGFSSLFKSQMSSLPSTEHVQTLSFDSTIFQPGFTWFLGFCIAGLFFSVMLKKLTHESFHE